MAGNEYEIAFGEKVHPGNQLRPTEPVEVEQREDGSASIVGALQSDQSGFKHVTSYYSPAAVAKASEIAEVRGIPVEKVLTEWSQQGPA